MKYLIANWKMNSIDISKWKNDFENHYKEFKDNLEIIVCPNFIDLSECSEKFTYLSIGAQDVSSHREGSFTGQISAKQLLKATNKLKYCIVGHSEVRHKGDSNFLVREKSEQLINNKIEPILCIGEDKDSLGKGERESFLLHQLNSYFENGSSPKLIAYEPIWAIGSDMAASPEQAQNMCSFIKDFIHSEVLTNGNDDQKKIPLKVVYGGSVNEKNTLQLLSLDEVDGALIGRCSLSADKFIQICNLAHQI